MIQRKIRQSQTLVPFGVGGIFDIQGESLVACDIYRWGPNKGDVVHSPRLTAALGINQLRSAPVIEANAWGTTPSKSIPYARFPVWLFCSKCRRMVRWDRGMEQDDKQPTCPGCAGERRLVPMRWIQICPKGHMGDVDWFWWAHQGSSKPEQRQCQKRKQLRFETAGPSGGGGLDTLSVRCDACRARKPLTGISSSGTAKRFGFKCSGRQPWQKVMDAVVCIEEVRIVQRGASNVYFPVVHSSIEIPSPSSSDTHSDKALEVQNDPMFEAVLSAEAGSVVAEFLITQMAETHDLDEIFLRSSRCGRAPTPGRFRDRVEASPGDLLGEEWAAFLTPTDDPDHPDFVTRHVGLGVAAENRESEALGELNDRVSRVVVADRLREVRALQGFHRVTTAPDTMTRVALGKVSHGCRQSRCVERESS